MKPLTSFVYAVLAGAAIAIGGVAFLSCESKVAGAFFFCLGLFTVWHSSAALSAMEAIRVVRTP